MHAAYGGEREAKALRQTQSNVARTTDELVDAIQHLSDADWIRLRKVARIYSSSRLIDEQDLLQEAFRRAIDGSRNCPANVDVVRFLAEAMRSIAHGEREKHEKRPALIPIANHSNSENEIDPPEPGHDPEESFVSNQEIDIIKKTILSVVEDDEIAQIILEGMMEGMEGKDLRDLTGLGKTDYESKRKLIRRRIEKGFPRGWKI